MLQINTSNLSTRVPVEIDGHRYVVRKIGAGEQLTLSQYMREIEKLENKNKAGQLSDEDEKRATDISEKTMDIMSGCFEDGEGGAKSKELVKKLSTDELQEMLTKIFEVKGESQVS